MLRELLGPAAYGYTVANYTTYIAVGSQMHPKLIKLDLVSNRITYALDPFNKGRESIADNKLKIIWDRLHELLLQGKLEEIIKGEDKIENPIPVFRFNGTGIDQSITDACGYPNITREGYVMHNNEWFDNRDDAVQRGIAETRSYLNTYNSQKEEFENKLKEISAKVESLTQVLKDLQNMQPFQSA